MMMLSGDDHAHPAVQIPPSDFRHVEDPTALTFSYEQLLAALQYRSFLPSNNDVVSDDDVDEGSDEFDFPADAFSGDDFRMFEFKVKKCAVVRSHDWTACPFAHPGEKARRRDPRKHHYSGSACPDFRRGGACARGDACEYAHGVFESWLHPARYRTQPCKDGTHCRRRVCFFAHTPEQLRVVSYAAESSSSSPPSRLVNLNFSPKSTLYYSPPYSSMSPATMSPPVSPSVMNSVDQLSESVRRLHFSRGRRSLRSEGVRSPRSPAAVMRSSFEAWGYSGGEEPLMERVESGRELRERIYAKLGKENSLVVPGPSWVG